MKATLHDLLDGEATLIADGAMGTELFARGLEAGATPEVWNVDAPDRVTAVHAAYVAAGADILLTNSFGGTRHRLGLHDLGDRVGELNAAAAACARAVADAAPRPVVVAGSMGPTGELLEPVGALSSEQCVDAFVEQASALVSGGVDALWIETMSDLDEAAAAVRAARSVTDLPVVVTLSFDTNGRSMMGVTGRQAVERLADLGVTAVGANCGSSLTDTEAAIAQMADARSDAVLVSKANAGVPGWVGDRLVYSAGPADMAAHAVRARVAGARIVGGCCGTGPEHVTRIRQAVGAVVGQR